jgi:hypothetical protein
MSLSSSAFNSESLRECHHADSIRDEAWQPAGKYSRESWTRQKMNAGHLRANHAESGQQHVGQPLRGKFFPGGKATPVS